MAITRTHLDDGFNNSDLATYVTGSVAITKPTAFFMFGVGASSLTSPPTITVPSGVTATHIDQANRGPQGAQINLWQLTGTGTGTVTVAYAQTNTGAIWWFTEFDGATSDEWTNHVSGNNVNAQNFDLTLPSTPDADSFVLMAVGMPTIGSPSWTAPTGMVDDATALTPSAPNRSLTVWYDEPPPAGAYYDPTSGSSSTVCGIAVEIPEAVALGTSGTSATTLSRVTADGSGSTGTTAVATTTLTRHVGAGAGSTGSTGTSAVTLNRVVGAGSGTSSTPGTSGTSATNLTRHTGTGSGATGASGASTATLTRATAVGSGATSAPGTTSGSGSPALTRATAAGSGETSAPSTTGSGSPTCTRHTAAGSGSTGLSGSAGVALVRHTATGAGTSRTSGSGAPTLGRHTGTGNGSTGTSGTGTLLLERHVAVGLQQRAYAPGHFIHVVTAERRRLRIIGERRRFPIPTERRILEVPDVV